jgi:hypothetical protein
VRDVVVTSDTLLKANFVEIGEEFLVDLISEPQNGGNLFGGGYFEENTSTFVSTFPSNNCYVFRNWTDEDGNIISEDLSFEVVVISDTVLIANFDLLQYDLTVKANENGSVNPNGTDRHDCGSTVEITAIPDVGYKFFAWRNSSGNIVSITNPLDVVIISDTVLTAEFIDEGEEPVEFIALTVGNNLGGSVSPSGTILILTAKGLIYTIFATPNNCYTFTHWLDVSGNIISYENPFDITLINDTALFANFEIRHVSFDVISNPVDGGTVSISGTEFDCGDEVIITAEANDGYDFINWVNENGEEISSDNPLTVTILSDTVLTANFIHTNIIDAVIKDLLISPNPTDALSTLTLDLLTSGYLTVTLNNLLGQELFEVYDGFVDIGTFRREFSIEHLPTGVYYLKISHNGNVTIEKVIKY